jgi:hypothetical protein
MAITVYHCYDRDDKGYVRYAASWNNNRTEQKITSAIRADVLSQLD